MNLTVSDIQADIEGFQARIVGARAGLKELPAGRLPFKEHKAREKQRREDDGGNA